MRLSDTDLVAIRNKEANFLLDRGADLYKKGVYSDAIEYYRIAASMGNIQAVSNLGYCYMYGRSVEKNTSLALAYFQYAADNNNIDALYKLGNFYMNGIEVKKDEDIALFYYEKALKELSKCSEEEMDLEYPSLFYSLAKEYMPGGKKESDLDIAFIFLNNAKLGYEYQIDMGSDYYQKQLEEVKKLLKDKMFDEIRTEYEFDETIEF